MLELKNLNNVYDIGDIIVYTTKDNKDYKIIYSEVYDYSCDLNIPAYNVLIEVININNLDKKPILLINKPRFILEEDYRYDLLDIYKEFPIQFNSIDDVSLNEFIDILGGISRIGGAITNVVDNGIVGNLEKASQSVSDRITNAAIKYGGKYGKKIEMAGGIKNGLMAGVPYFAAKKFDWANNLIKNVSGIDVRDLDEKRKQLQQDPSKLGDMLGDFVRKNSGKIQKNLVNKATNSILRSNIGSNLVQGATNVSKAINDIASTGSINQSTINNLKANFSNMTNGNNTNNQHFNTQINNGNNNGLIKQLLAKLRDFVY